MSSRRVSDYMTPWIHTARADDPLGELRAKLIGHDISCLAIEDERHGLVGVVSRTDILARRQLGDPMASVDKIRAAEVMTTKAVRVEPSASIQEAAALMVKRSVHRVFVTAGVKLEGVLSTRDVMQAIRDERVRHTVGEFSTSPVFAIGVYEPLSQANDLLQRARISGLVVIDGDFPVGIYTQREALLSATKPSDSPLESSMNPAIALAPPALPVFRAASQAVAMRVRRVVTIADSGIAGIVTGLDFARAAAQPA